MYSDNPLDMRTEIRIREKITSSMSKKIADKNTVRLFVSSTFQDMTEERDLLNRIVFPHLREFCRKRGLGFIGLDLRWGITEEDTKNNRTLEICLNEIDRSRPYFVGIIGKRYGWIPPKTLYKSFDYKFPQGISITEAEIIYGAFDQHKANAVFCLKKLPEDVNCDNKVKLDALRQAVLNSEYPQLKDYQTSSDIADFLIEQITAQIEKDYPERVFLDDYQMANIRQEDFLRRESENFSGRTKAIQAIKNLIAGKNTLIFVDSIEGGGKTALLAALIRCLALMDDTFLFYFFKEAMSQSLGWDFTLKRLIKTLCLKMGTEYIEPDTEEKTVAEFSSILWRASRILNTILLVFDGIEALNQSPQYGISWLTTNLPPQVKIIYSSNDTSVTSALTKRGVKTYKIDALSASEKKQLITGYLHQYGKKLDKRFVPMTISAPMSGNPRFLRTILSELTVWNNYETLRERLKYYALSNNLVELYSKVLERIESEYDVNLVRDTLVMLYISKYGLSETELTSVLGVSLGAWMPVFYALKPYLFESGEIVYLSDHQLKETVSQRYIDKKTKRQAQYKLSKLLYRSKRDIRQTRLLFELLRESGSIGRLFRMFVTPNTLSVLWTESPYWVREIHDCLIQNNYDITSVILTHILRSKRTNANQLLNITEYLVAVGNQPNALIVLDKIADKEKLTPEESMRLLSLKGNILLHIGNLNKAQKTFEEKLNLSLNTGNQLEYARVSASLGQIALAGNNYKKAQKNYTKSLESFIRSFYPYGVQAAYGNLGNVYTLSDNLPKAMSMYQKQEQICAETHNFDGLNNALTGQFVIALKLNDFTKCEKIAVRQKTICEQYGNIKGLELTLGNQAVLAYKRQQFDETHKLLKEKYRLAVATEHYEGQITALTNLADLAFERDQIADSVSYAEQAVSLCRRKRSINYLHFALKRLSYFYKKNNQHEKAAMMSTEAELLAETHGVVENYFSGNSLLMSISN